MVPDVVAFVCARWALAGGVTVRIRPLTGGLESAVTHATVEAAGNTAPRSLIVKELRGDFRREAAVYRLLWTLLDRPPLAEVFGVQSTAEAEYLYLEEIRSAATWPWADTGIATLVCRELARLHALRALDAAPIDRDYEAELAESAAQTLEVAERVRDERGARWWRRPGDLRRVARALPELRARLFRDGVTLIHGDVHPGNVIVARGTTSRVVLIDWGRARVGSPLEDVASWLQSLCCWEPEAARRHDTLLREYLRARGLPAWMDPPLRRDYWFAGASNGLAGAIRYHLVVLSNGAADPGLRSHACVALRAWERVIRRAAALLTPGWSD